MKRELEKYGLQLPAFSKIGGILANELSVDEAAGDGCPCGERCCASACSRILAQPLNIKSRASKLRDALRDALLQTCACLQGLAQPLPSQQHQGFCVSWACCRDVETFRALETAASSLRSWGSHHRAWHSLSHHTQGYKGWSIAALHALSHLHPSCFTSSPCCGAGNQRSGGSRGGGTDDDGPPQPQCYASRPA